MTYDRLRKHYFIAIAVAGKEPMIIGSGDGKNGLLTRQDAEAKLEMLKFETEEIKACIIEVGEEAYEA